MKQAFGTLDNGEQAHLFTLENEHFTLLLTDYGARMVSMIEKHTGIDTLLGYDTLEAYEHFPNYFGASIGRVANRIKDGVFTLNGKEYRLAKNNAGNHLHGGLSGFDQKIFAAEEKDDEILFRYTSPDGEEGYPGELSLTVAYHLLPDGVEITTDATAADDTVFAFTNHAYFNLDGAGTILAHVTELSADTYVVNDENGLALEDVRPVEGTAFDFRTPKTLGEEMDKVGLYDNHFPVAGSGIRRMAKCSGKQLQLVMESDYDGFHMFTAKFDPPRPGKNGAYYTGPASVCFEAEYYPNGINYPSVKSKPIVRKGETQHHTIRYLITPKD